uniref:Transmembrane 4 L6 family member 4 n=1 Tax=Leptobrachium leishanense TaxID=445787 RepID=A0A8C5M6B3_9ANUR
MCSGSCAKCLGITIIPLATVCILANILLFFPGGEVVSANEYISDEIWYFGGILGSGVLMLLPALAFLSLKKIDGSVCCANVSCGKICSMFYSMLFAVIGALGACYCFVTSILAINNGPKCLTADGWTYPFKNGDHLWNSGLWEKCIEPTDIVQWHLTLFSLLLIMSGVQAVLCAIQAIDGFIKTICVDCQCFKCRKVS